MFQGLSIPHLLVIAVVLLVLFGRGKVSSLMGEVGKGITAFKKGIEDNSKPAVDATTTVDEKAKEKDKV